MNQPAPRRVEPADTTRRDPVAELIAAYEGRIHLLLRTLADHSEISLAYVDRGIVEAHLDRDLNETEWAAIRARFTAMSFDDHIGNCGTLRTDWIDQLLDHADVRRPGPPAGHAVASDPAGRRP